MSYVVTVMPSGKQFNVDADETILAAGLRQNVIMPYGCKNGACGSCKGKVVEGQIVQGAHQPGALTEFEQTSGGALFCCAKPLTNVTIEARVVGGAGDFPIKKMPCRVASIDRPASDVAVIRLQLPATDKLQYKAGQYVDILLRDGSRRSYSMANPPHSSEQLELHVRHMPGGKFTDPVFGAVQPAMKEKDILRFEGAMGTFFLRESSNKPIVMLASGTGFAPIKAMIEHMKFKSIVRPVTLYWGGRRPADLYMDALAMQWAQEIPGFIYVPVISNATAQDQWSGRTGFVHLAVIEDLPDLSGYQVYACGAPVVVDSARKDFVARCQLPEDEFFADSFTSAADTAPALLA
jgi:CDP-4-dehydro-6-deoxyglucose reductase, E3